MCPVRIEADGPVTTVTIKRPGVPNAAHEATRIALAEAFTRRGVTRVAAYA